MTSRTERTREHLTAVALKLFETRGFDAVTVGEIAQAAGVSHMTVFRHFPTKEDIVVSDPFDPLIAAAVAEQSSDLSPFERARRGLAHGWATLGAALPPDAPPADTLTRRIRLVAGHPGLRARMWEGTHATTQAIAQALQAGGATPLEAQAAAGACIGALTAALLHWGQFPAGQTPGEAILAALHALEGQQ